MNPANFELQHSDIDQPKLLDGECAFREWPMPAGGVWVPRPAADEEDAEVLRVRNMPHDPAEERNPIARALTRLMTWGQR